MSLAGKLADLISVYLGPTFPRPKSQNGQSAAVEPIGVKTLVLLRNQIDRDPNSSQVKRDFLIWQLREAIRTEFFQIKYPAPPSEGLLNLVTTSELILTEFGNARRPIYFPGARVAVPTEVGTHRAATTLQLRFKQRNKETETEVLLHLDGPSGGSFQWVPSKILMLLSSCVPIPSPDARATAPKNIPNRPLTVTGGNRGRRTSANTTAVTGIPNSTARANRGSRSRKTDHRSNAPRGQTTSLPATFLPFALRSTSPPPRKRLRHDFNSPHSLSTGVTRRALDSWHLNPDIVREAFEGVAPSSILCNTLGIERLVARRRNMSLEGQIQYFVKWCGVPLSAASWESRESLLCDVPGLVLAFDTAHPSEPTSCRAVAHESSTQDAYLDGETVEEAEDNASNIFPIVSLQFCGMRLDIREGQKYNFYINESEFKLDRKMRITRFKKKNREAFDKIFASNATYAHVESKMMLQPDTSIMSTPNFQGNMVHVLQKSVDAHHANSRVAIPFPRGLGSVLSRDIPSVVPNADIRSAPASWESYLLSLGLNCRNWERELLPDMPTVSGRVLELVEQKANDMYTEARNVTAERNKAARRRTLKYVGKPRIRSPVGVQLKANPAEGDENSSVVRAAMEIAKNGQGAVKSSLWADYMRPPKPQ